MHSVSIGYMLTFYIWWTLIVMRIDNFQKTKKKSEMFFLEIGNSFIPR